MIVVNKSKFSVVLFLFVAGFTVNFQNAEAHLLIASVNTLTDAMRYLLKLGYIRESKEVAAFLNPQEVPSLVSSSSHAQSALRMAFSTFQQYAKLTVTGEFDEPTKRKMNTPRCGNKDIIPEVNAPSAEETPLAGISNKDTFLSFFKRKKRFMLSRFKWHKTELTFRFATFSESGFDSTIIQREVLEAFEHWSNVTNLIFTRTDNLVADIEIKFARGEHGDNNTFDGRGMDLAHAFSPGPEIGGDIHFEFKKCKLKLFAGDDEEWSSKVLSGTNFFYLAVHEIGHALGLGHSYIEDAGMYAFTRGYTPNFKLHEDDVLGIMSLYGKKEEVAPTPGNESTTAVTASSPDTNPEGTTNKPIVGSGSIMDFCRDPKIYDFNRFKNGDIFAFKDPYAFRNNGNGKGNDHKRWDRINYFFNGLRTPIRDVKPGYSMRTFPWTWGLPKSFHNWNF